MKLRHVCSFLAAGVLVFSFTGSTAKIDNRIHPIHRLGTDLQIDVADKPNTYKRSSALIIPASALAPKHPPLPVRHVTTKPVLGPVAAAPAKIEAAVTHARPDVELKASVGVIAMKLPSINLKKFSNMDHAVVGTQRKHDGDVLGSKLDASIGLRIVDTPIGYFFLETGGFFASAHNNRHTTCQDAARIIGCDWYPSFGQDAPNGTFSSSYGTSIITRQDVSYRGVALKVGMAPSPTVSVFAGGDLRRLKLSTTLKGLSGELPVVQFNSDESLTTTYAGAFAGATGQADLGRGFFLRGAAQIGFYRAKSQLAGRNHDVRTNISVEDKRSASKTTYIASLNSEVGYAAGGFTVAAFAELEGLGWAPKLHYHDHKDNVAIGTPSKTAEIVDGRALNYTVGGRLNVKF